MNRTRDQVERYLRWYPPAWRARYSEELASLSEDLHGSTGLPLSDRLSLVRTGLHERARSVGLRGTGAPPGQRVRSASLVVLCCWTAFVVAGAVFAKLSDNWSALTPPRHRRIPGTGYSLVQGAGEVGVLIVLVGVLVALPAFVRLLRSGGWSAVRRPMERTAIAGVSMVALTMGLIGWAHHLSGQARNGGSLLYGVAFVLWAVLGVTALCVATWSGVSVALRLPFSTRSLRALGVLAAVLTVDMVLVVGGVLLWWVALADQAPQVLGSGLLATPGVVPPLLAGSALVMVGALVAAVAGSCRILRSFRSV